MNLKKTDSTICLILEEAHYVGSFQVHCLGSVQQCSSLCPIQYCLIHNHLSPDLTPDAVVQSALQLTQDTSEQFWIKGLAQGPDSGSLGMLGFALVTFQSGSQ